MRVRKGKKTIILASAAVLLAVLCAAGCRTARNPAQEKMTGDVIAWEAPVAETVDDGAVIPSGQNTEEPNQSGAYPGGSMAAAGNDCSDGNASNPAGTAGNERPDSNALNPAEASGKDRPDDSASAAGDPLSGTPTLSTPSMAGALRVEGTQLVGSGGEAVQLRGISTHGLAWFPDYVNEACFRELRESWQANVIRLALYTAEYGGYCSGGDRETLKGLVEAGVEYAEQTDLYVIIDWHILSDGNPNTHREEAKEFFSEMSARYADREHVLYEICNEPNGGTTWQEIKAYAEEVIGVIRENDADAVILVGTPNWSQYVDQAAADPIAGHENLMYTLHFYAATHKEELREKMTAAAAAGLPVFVSEFGICDASGSGGIDEEQANAWVRQMDTLGISYVAWNLSNKEETSALLKSSCQKSSGFDAEDLSASGQWLYQVLAGDRELPQIESETQTSSSRSGTGGAGQSAAGSAGQSDDGNQANTMAAPPEPGPAASPEHILTNGSIEITASLVGSWEADGQPVYHYSLTLRNTSESECSGWAVDVEFTGEITLLDEWNGEYSADGSSLHISSKDYNAGIAAGASISGVGFIVSGGSIAP